MSVGALTGIAVLGVAPSSAAGPRAVAARTISLKETGSLHRTSSSGLKLNEQGSASGTIKGKIFIHLDVVSPNRVTAEVNIYPSGGSHRIWVRRLSRKRRHRELLRQAVNRARDRQLRRRARLRPKLQRHDPASEWRCHRAPERQHVHLRGVRPMSKIRAATVALLVCCCCLPATAGAVQTATLQTSFSPNKLGASTTIAGSAFRSPTPKSADCPRR